MKTQITLVGIAKSEAIQNYIYEHVQKLEEKNFPVRYCEVWLQMDNSQFDAGEDVFHCEISSKLDHRGAGFVKKTASDAYAAIHFAFDALLKILRREKEKRVSARKHREGRRIEGTAPEEIYTAA